MKVLLHDPDREMNVRGARLLQKVLMTREGESTTTETRVDAADALHVGLDESAAAGLQ